jgi:hypothetical protein
VEERLARSAMERSLSVTFSRLLSCVSVWLTTEIVALSEPTALPNAFAPSRREPRSEEVDASAFDREDEPAALSVIEEKNAALITDERLTRVTSLCRLRTWDNPFLKTLSGERRVF